MIVIGVQRTPRRYMSDQVARVIFFMCAALLIVVIVCVFLFVGANALRIFFDPGGASFSGYFFNATWDPGANLTDTPQYGAAGLIVGSLVITFFAALIATPLSIGVALYFTEVAPRRIVRFFQPLLEIFVGMPSVVIGFIGLVVLVPFLTKIASGVTSGNAEGGFGWGAAILVLVVMIVPTISSIAIDALRVVPQ